MNETEQLFFDTFNHNARRRAKELDKVLSLPGMSATDKERIRGAQ